LPGDPAEENRTVLEEDSKRMHREWMEQLPDDVRAAIRGS
jgi:hypothetical protein